MKLLIFIIVYPLIWILSILPMRLLYIISDFFRFIVFGLVGYRKKVVVENLKMAFPDKSDKEIKKIARKFYKHFVDLIFESIKAFTISEKEVLKRYKYKNPELVNNLTKEGKSIILLGAHQANWEWSFSLPLVLDTQVFGAYTRLTNKYFEKAVKNSRTKFGIEGLKTSETIKGIHKNYLKKIQGAYILLSDQSPQVHKTHYWTEFFGIKVPIHTGAEILAKRYDFTVINYTVKKIKRGYFETEFELITDSPKDFENYQITDKYLEITERNIKEQPECYLWTHKRFKHKDKYEQWLENRKASQK
ncbi:lipid A biosynthesis acyltransferase [Tenacibaculum discolor]|uniref:Lipid A biosynthesis acyltransferase n=1 Tax=Tenacibaculum discolor TaxID=361581 RepID=A0A2G1BYW6_9FLAO|nr:lysophospholipid acyltransferase family protein [Tenacibaculum discolor]MDP2541354.1 lysophospholipid acyltransferase family protein [Tenacibaculum discolor]PHN99188.1 lipid A biosynthesis acyltransferase [Tenacibaculum discolor]